MKTMEAGNPQVIWQNLIRAETQPPSIFLLSHPQHVFVTSE